MRNWHGDTNCYCCSGSLQYGLLALCWYSVVFCTTNRDCMYVRQLGELSGLVVLILRYSCCTPTGNIVTDRVGCMRSRDECCPIIALLSRFNGSHLLWSSVVCRRLVGSIVRSSSRLCLCVLFCFCQRRRQVCSKCWTLSAAVVNEDRSRWSSVDWQRIETHLNLCFAMQKRTDH